MTNPSGDVTTVVIEMEPGWVYVKIADPKPEPSRIEFFLRRAIHDWFAAHPTLVIDKAEAITDHGEMLGIHVWYHEEPGPLQVAKRPEGATGTFTIEVHGRIAQEFSREYIEAVLDDALRILPSFEHRQDTLVVINPRRVAVVLDKQTHKGAVLPLDLIERVIDGTMKAKLAKWLANPPASFYVMHIAGSWFGSSQ